MPERILDWGTVDRFLAGPAVPPAGCVAAPFVIPRNTPTEFRVGRIRSGKAWPGEIPVLDRIASVPLPAGCCEGPEVANRDVVLTFEPFAGRSFALCSLAPGGTPNWRANPATWLQGILGEAYVARWRRPVVSRVPLVNYSRAPHGLRTLLRGVQDPVTQYSSRLASSFPSVPVDVLAESLRGLCFALAFGEPAKPGRLWPGERLAAITLTHDVDSSWILGTKRCSLLQEIVETESSLGFRGAWYIVGDQLRRARHGPALQLIRDAGQEIGAHGWNHDAKLQYLAGSRQERRMERIRTRFADLGVTGIRTPWLARSEQLFRVLARHFEYDTSVPNVSSFFSSGTNSGCCSLFPYRPLSGLMELPLTLPPDTALDPATGHQMLWELSRSIIRQGGVVVVSMHPQPHQSGNRAALDRYFSFIRRLSDAYGDELWHATPRDIVGHYEFKVSCRVADAPAGDLTQCSQARGAIPQSLRAEPNP